MNQPPLNPDALANLRLLADEGTRELRHVVLEPDLLHKILDIADSVALPEVTGEQVNFAGWTCNGIHEPGDYSTCNECREACDDLANFYNQMMRNPRPGKHWTGKPALPEVTQSEELSILIGDVKTAIDHEHIDPREFIDLNDVLWALEAQAKPEVTSVEELDQLPMHSYVQGADGFKHAKDWNGGWHLIVNRPSSAPHLSGSIDLPARVLYRPEVKP